MKTRNIILISACGAIIVAALIVLAAKNNKLNKKVDEIQDTVQSQLNNIKAHEKIIGYKNDTIADLRADNKHLHDSIGGLHTVIERKNDTLTIVRAQLKDCEDSKKPQKKPQPKPKNPQPKDTVVVITKPQPKDTVYVYVDDCAASRNTIVLDTCAYNSGNTIINNDCCASQNEVRLGACAVNNGNIIINNGGGNVIVNGTVVGDTLHNVVDTVAKEVQKKQTCCVVTARSCGIRR